MADCSEQFLEFAEALAIEHELPTLSARMKASKKQVQEAIKNYLLRTKAVRTPPSFKLQGSYKLGTLVRPIPGVPVDIDLGVHIDLGENKDDWVTPKTVHTWIYEALTSGTSASAVPIKKYRCVRQEYAGDYHIDVPVYAHGKSWFSDKKCYLADSGENNWVESDPRAFEAWILAGGVTPDPAFVRTIRVLKCWGAHRFGRSKPKCISGFILTVLAGLHMDDEIDEDDKRVADLFDTLVEVFDDCSEVYNPVNADEDLLDQVSDAQWSTFLNELETAADISTKALEARSTDKACHQWQRLFGPRFPSS